MKKYLCAIACGVLCLCGTLEAAEQIHLLIVGDDNDNSRIMQASIQADMKLIGAAFSENVPPKQLHTVKLSKDNVTKEKIFDAITKLEAKPEDCIVFYYAGHGAWDKNDQSPALTLMKERKPVLRSDIVTALQSKKPRLAVILTDCCSAVPDETIRPRHEMGPGEEPEKISPLFTSLFITPTGLIDITAAEKGYAAYIYTGDHLYDSRTRRFKGGIFTWNLISVMEEKWDSTLTWDEFFRQVSERTNSECQKCQNLTQRPFRLK